MKKMARSNATTENLPPVGCERRHPTQMTSKSAFRRPAKASLGRLLGLCAQNFCFFSYEANQIKTNQSEALATRGNIPKSFNIFYRIFTSVDSTAKITHFRVAQARLLFNFQEAFYGQEGCLAIECKARTRRLAIVTAIVQRL